MAESKVDSALRKVTSLPGVQAAFVFDQTQTITAREVPSHYSNDILKRIALQLFQLTLHSRKAGIRTTEYRLIYDGYAIYLRRFARFFYLTVFTDKNLLASDFKQPLNLAVLVLEKALRSDESFETNSVLSKIALLAEQALKDRQEIDESFAGKFRKMCGDFLGQTGRDLVDLVTEEQLLVPPLRTETDMRKLREGVLAQVVHPLKRKIIEKDSEDLINHCLSKYA